MEFLDTVTKMIPFYAARSIGGTLYLIGAILMAFNLYKTAKAGSFLADEDAEARRATGAVAARAELRHRRVFAEEAERHVEVPAVSS